MSYPVYAITRSSGPVILRSYETERQQMDGYREARRMLADNQFDSDVADIALGVDPGERKEDAKDRDVTALMAAFAGMDLGGAGDTQTAARETGTLPVLSQSQFAFAHER